MTVDAAGALSVRVGAGAVSEDAPVAWQEIGGRRAPVAARYTLAADGTAGFALGAL